MVFRFPVQESWCELMEAMSSVAEGATGVILARAGRSHVPEEVSSSSRVHGREGFDGHLSQFTRWMKPFGTNSPVAVWWMV